MNAIVNLNSYKENEICKFLNLYFENENFKSNIIKWEKQYDNPLEIADIIGVFIDNNDKYNINMWISLDMDFYLNITDRNANIVIKYLFERYPY